jgi:hypothetical protein
MSSLETSEVYRDKWGGEPVTPTVKAFHGALRARVAERLHASGRRWEDVVFDLDFLPTTEEFAAIEAELLATGYRFDHSAQISLVENPERYKASASEAAAAPAAEPGPDGNVVGAGDNAFRHHSDIEGVARFIATVETVMDMLADGVPPETIAIIDDAGGTLTAPILEGFTGIICKGGTIKSHLGVLSREYCIPCLMGAELGGVQEGDRVRIESTKNPPDTSAEAVRAASRDRARIWKIVE